MTTPTLPPLIWHERALWQTAVEVIEPKNAIEELSLWLEFQRVEREIADTVPADLPPT